MSSHRFHHSQSSDTARHPHNATEDASDSVALQSLKTISDTFKTLPSVSETLRELPLCIEKLQQVIDSSSTDLNSYAEIDEIVESLRADSNQFLEILRLSEVEASQEYQFSIEMIELCDILIQGSTDGKQTGELLEKMKDRAVKMRESSSQVAQELRRVNDRLVETGRNIPIAVGQLVTRKQYVVDKKKTAERLAKPLKVMRGVFTTAGGVVGLLGGISSISFPPVALLALSVVFPILSVLVNVVEVSNKKRIKERRVEERELKAAIQKLKKTSSALNNMIDHLDAFTQFWENIELLLADIGDRLGELEHLRSSKSTKIQIKMMRNLWADTNEEYRKYRDDLKNLRSIYSQLQGSSRSSNSVRSNGTVSKIKR